MTAIAIRPHAVPRGIALQPSRQQGIAIPGRQLFTVIGAVAGPRGLQGIPGPAGGEAVQRLAGEVISALQAVYELNGQVHLLDYRDDAHIDLLLGITLTAAGAGAPVNVQRSGVLEDSNWSWTPGRVWLGPDGSLTQTPPADGYCVLIGSATSATRLTLNLQDPIELEN